MANTSVGSHMSEGNDVMRRLRYLEAISLAFAIRCVLKTTSECSSDDRCLGNACCEAFKLRSVMESRMTFQRIRSTESMFLGSERTFSATASMHALSPGCSFRLSFIK